MDTTGGNILGFKSFFASLVSAQSSRGKPSSKMKQNKQKSQCSSDFNYLQWETNVRIDLGVGQKENII
jgi:hypothetical protein